MDKYNIQTYDEFLRKGLSNKKSPIYINQEKEIIKAKEVVDLIHICGGLAFLAHTYKYTISNHIEFLKQLLKENVKLDGVEVDYPTFTNKQKEELIKFAKDSNLYMSGGSDYHGKKDRTESLGKGTNGKSIPQYIEGWYEKIKERCL